MKSKLFLTLLVACLIFGLSSVAPVSAAGEVPVNVNCSSEVSKGSYFVASIEIGMVTHLNAAQFILEVDPGLVTLDSKSSGSIGGTAFNMQYTESEPGRYVFFGYAGMSTLTGDGSLVTLNFYAVESGTAQISLSGGMLSSMDSEQAVPSTWTGSTVTITSDETTGGTTDQGSGTTGSVPPTTGTATTTQDQTPVTSTTSSSATTTDNSTSANQTSAATDEQTTIDETSGVVVTTSGEGGSDVQIIQQSDTIVVDNEGNEISDQDQATEADPTESIFDTEIKWPVLFGIIGGVLVIVALVVYANTRKRGYLG